MEFYAYHGHFKEEQVVGNKFLVSIAIETDCSKAAESDQFNDALGLSESLFANKAGNGRKSHLLGAFVQGFWIGCMLSSTRFSRH
jgi:7,8-dihydroneopterin aldolase/epimerase/oxygenase